jgi:fumarate hydratase class I
LPRSADLIESVADALQYISYYHPPTTSPARRAPTSASSRPAAKDAIAQILTNSRMCAEGHRPICQDTGIVNVFLKVGMDVRWEGATMAAAEMVNEGVRRAYLTPTTAARLDRGRPGRRAQEHQGQHAGGVHMRWCPATRSK